MRDINELLSRPRVMVGAVVTYKEKDIRSLWYQNIGEPPKREYDWGALVPIYNVYTMHRNRKYKVVDIVAVLSYGWWSVYSRVRQTEWTKIGKSVKNGPDLAACITKLWSLAEDELEESWQTFNFV